MRNSDNKRKILLSLFFGSGILYLLVTYLVSNDLFRDLDYRIMVFLQNSVPRSLDKALSVFTVVGSSEVTAMLLLLLVAVLLRKYRKVFLPSVTFFAIFAVELFGKIMIFHPSPPAMFSRYALPVHFPSSFVVHTVSSYPSGHMSRASFIAVLYCFFLLKSAKSRMGKAFIIFSFLLFISGMFLSRIYLGDHWFSDVLGGSLLGFSAAFFSLFLI